MGGRVVNLVQSLHIPDHIRFECSGCGNCCLEWPVPATSEDVTRIETLTAAGGFRTLQSGDQKFRGFSHTLEKRQDGRCRFLTESNRCRLHEEHGEEAKPAMCRLFPHAFSFTPSGVYAYVSFASSAVLSNHGRLLSEQRELLEAQLKLYEQLFPATRPDWSQLQLLDGFPLSWDDFLTIDKQLLHIFERTDLQSTEERLGECSSIVAASLPPGANAEKMPPLEASPATVDRIILKHLFNAYLPADVFSHSEFDIDARALMTDIVQSSGSVMLDKTPFERLESLTLGRLDDSIEQLIHRFAYARLFAKLYLGPNFAHLSLLSGIHHLCFLVGLIRLRIKQMMLDEHKVDFPEAAEVVRTIERRLSQMNFSAQSSAVMEVLFSSPSRPIRLQELIR
jgi:Fe-S-cluster containining protein